MKPDWMQEILTKANERKALAAQLAQTGRPVRLFGTGGTFALASPDMSRGGSYRLTWFDQGMPTGHTEHRTLEEAIDEGLRNRLKPHDELGPLPVRDPIAIVALGIFIAAVMLWARILENV